MTLLSALIKAHLGKTFATILVFVFGFWLWTAHTSAVEDAANAARVETLQETRNADQTNADAIRERVASGRASVRLRPPDGEDQRGYRD